MVSYKYTFIFSYLFDGKVWSTGNIAVVEPGVWKNLSVKWGSHSYGSEEDDCKTYLVIPVKFISIVFFVMILKYNIVSLNQNEYLELVLTNKSLAMLKMVNLSWWKLFKKDCIWSWWSNCDAFEFVASLYSKFYSAGVVL